MPVDLNEVDLVAGGRLLMGGVLTCGILAKLSGATAGAGALEADGECGGAWR